MRRTRSVIVPAGTPLMTNVPAAVVTAPVVVLATEICTDGSADLSSASVTRPRIRPVPWAARTEDTIVMASAVAATRRPVIKSDNGDRMLTSRW
jgi:hypothetical protein